MFHRACISRISDSVRTRLERDNRTVVAENNRLLSRLAFEEARSQRTAAALTATEAELGKQGEQLRVYNRELMESAADIARLRRELDQAVANANRVQARAEAAEQALDSIARTAAARQPVTTPDEKQAGKDPENDLVVRASLLELE